MTNTSGIVLSFITARRADMRKDIVCEKCKGELVPYKKDFRIATHEKAWCYRYTCGWCGGGLNRGSHRRLIENPFVAWLLPPRIADLFRIDDYLYCWDCNRTYPAPRHLFRYLVWEFRVMGWWIREWVTETFEKLLLASWRLSTGKQVSR